MLQHGDPFASHRPEHIQSVQKYRRDVNLYENLSMWLSIYYCVKECVKLHTS